MKPYHQKPGFSVLLLAILASLFTQSTLAQVNQNLYQEFELELKTEYSFFFNQGLYPGQARHFPSLAIEPEYYLEWADGKQSLNFTGFFRVDRDSRRTHWDIRELYWQNIKNDWELSIGVKKVFWGKTESIHLVDIINQTDQLESFDGEEKLGQPMVHFSYLSKIGLFDLFIMPYFRQRQFPGEKGRFRAPFILSGSDFSFESSAKKWHPDFAVRWSHSLGPLDIGLSHFRGAGREPIFEWNDQDASFNLVYAIIHQTGLDIQATIGPWLWKFEGISRLNDYKDVFAFAAGFEYTFGNIKSSGIDIGVLGEYLYDSRKEQALSSMDNDIFFGSRIAFNDVQSTEILLGSIFDLNRRSKFFSLEASRRFGNNWKAEINIQILSDISEKEFSYFFRDDSVVKVNLSRFF